MLLGQPEVSEVGLWHLLTSAVIDAAIIVFEFCNYTIGRQGAVAAAGAKTTQQQPSDAIQKAMEATLASIALPAKATSASASASAATSSSPVVALSDR